MDMQNAAKLEIPEGEVRTIHDKNGDLLWGKVGYGVKYKGNTAQNGTPTPSAPVAVQTVTGENVVKICGKNLFDKSTDTIAYYLDASGNIVSGGTWSVSDYIAVNPGENYTISGVGTPGQAPRYCFYNSNKQFVSAATTGNQTVTVPSGANYIRLSIYNGTNGQHPNDENTLQLELGSSASTYEAYKSQSCEVNLGKNLCNGTSQGYWINGVANSAGLSSGNTGLAIPVLPNTDYSVSTKTTQARYRAAFVDSLPASDSSVTAYNGVARDGQGTSFTRNSATHRYLIVNATNLSDIQVELGSQATSYAAYFEPIELCGLGDDGAGSYLYQDYFYPSGGKWYVHKETGKSLVDGTIGNLSRTGTNRFNIDNISLGWEKLQGAILCLADRYSTVAQYLTNGNFDNAVSSMSYALGLHPEADTIRIKDVNYDNAANYKTWLGNDPINLYYALATPTDTEITNQALIAQLEAVNQWTTRYGYNASVTGNLPIIIDRTQL